ncbi:hypothetical protein D3C80_1529150 [compost metagenome]
MVTSTSSAAPLATARSPYQMCAPSGVIRCRSRSVPSLSHASNTRSLAGVAPPLLLRNCVRCRCWPSGLRTSTLLLPSGNEKGRSKRPAGSIFRGMLTPLTINRPGSVDLGVALIWPLMRAVLA